MFLKNYTLGGYATLYKKIWLAIFFYVLIPALLFQLVVLPYVFPSWHGGNGLLAGGDWIAYHSIAVELSERIITDGWSAWQLRPQHQAPAGLAAAIYTITGINKPWVLLPLNAMLHATAALVLLAIFVSITGRFKTAFWAILPFTLFPTAFLWNSALHKDGAFILGSLLTIYGFVLFASIEPKAHLTRLVKASFALIIGLLLVWVVRPYGIEMFLYIAFVITLPFSAYLFFNGRRNRLLYVNIIVIWAILFMLYPLTDTGVHHQYVDHKLFPSGIPPEPASPVVVVTDTPTESKKVIQVALTAKENVVWNRTKFLPQDVDQTFYALSVMRNRYLTHTPYAHSNIDLHIRFDRAADVFLYIPRALQIGLLAPFPVSWFTAGYRDSTSFMRRINAAEMLIIYLALPFSAIALWLWRKKPEIFLLYGFTLGMILAYALVVANVGTLHRMRYGFLMALVGSGLAALAELANRRSLKHGNSYLGEE